MERKSIGDNLVVLCDALRWWAVACGGEDDDGGEVDDEQEEDEVRDEHEVREASVTPTVRHQRGSR